MDVSTNRTPTDTSAFIVGNGNSGYVSGANLKKFTKEYHEAYYSNGVMYSDSTHTESITGVAGHLYLDLHTSTLYKYNSTSGFSAVSDTVDVSGKEDKSNKVTSLSASSTDAQYPSAKSVYDAISAEATARTTADATKASQTEVNGLKADITEIDAKVGQNPASELKGDELLEAIEGFTIGLTDFVAQFEQAPTEESTADLVTAIEEHTIALGGAVKYLMEREAQ